MLIDYFLVQFRTGLVLNKKTYVTYVTMWFIKHYIYSSKIP
jgi:hypothetical protein